MLSAMAAETLRLPRPHLTMQRHASRARRLFVGLVVCATSSSTMQALFRFWCEISVVPLPHCRPTSCWAALQRPVHTHSKSPQPPKPLVSFPKRPLLALGPPTAASVSRCWRSAPPSPSYPITTGAARARRCSIEIFGWWLPLAVPPLDDLHISDLKTLMVRWAPTPVSVSACADFGCCCIAPCFICRSFCGYCCLR